MKRLSIMAGRDKDPVQIQKDLEELGERLEHFGKLLKTQPTQLAPRNLDHLVATAHEAKATVRKLVEALAEAWRADSSVVPSPTPGEDSKDFDSVRDLPREG